MSFARPTWQLPLGTKKVFEQPFRYCTTKLIRKSGLFVKYGFMTFMLVRDPNPQQADEGALLKAFQKLLIVLVLW